MVMNRPSNRWVKMKFFSYNLALMEEKKKSYTSYTFKEMEQHSAVDLYLGKKNNNNNSK